MTARSVAVAAVFAAAATPVACGGGVDDTTRRPVPEASTPDVADARAGGETADVVADGRDASACPGASGTITRIGQGYYATHMVAGTRGRIYALGRVESCLGRVDRALWRFQADGGGFLATCKATGWLARGALAFDATRRRLLHGGAEFSAWFEDEDGAWLRADTSVSSAAGGSDSVLAADATGLRFVLDRSARTDPAARNVQTSYAALGIRFSRVVVEVAPDTSAFLPGQSSDGLPALIRLLPESPAVDGAFGDAGVVRVGATAGIAREVALDSQSRLLVNVAVGPADCSACDVRIARLTPSGSIDPVYGTSGFATVPAYQYAYSELRVFLADGDRAVVAGMSPQDARVVRLIRLTSSGALDASFGAGGIVDLPPTANNTEGLMGAVLVKETSCGAYVVLVGGAGLFRITP